MVKDQLDVKPENDLLLYEGRTDDLGEDYEAHTKPYNWSVLRNPSDLVSLEVSDL